MSTSSVAVNSFVIEPISNSESGPAGSSPGGPGELLGAVPGADRDPRPSRANARESWRDSVGEVWHRGHRLA